MIRLPVKTSQAFALLLALCLLILCDLAVGLSPLTNKLDMIIKNPMRAKFQDLTRYTHPPIDVLVMGTSRTQYGFNPGVFEQLTQHRLSSYNFGLPQLGYDWINVYLPDYVHRYGKPKLLILETMDLVVNRQYFSGELYYENLVAQAPSLIPVVLSDPHIILSDKLQIVLAMASTFYRYRMILCPMKLLKWAMSPDSIQAQPYRFQQGWLPYSGPGEETPDLKNWIRPGFLPVDTSALTLTLGLCRQLHIPVVMLEWPDRPDYSGLSSKMPEVQAYHKAMLQVSQVNHVPYLDLSHTVQANNSGLFADTRHVNAEGATVFTTLMVQQLKKQSVSPLFK